MNGAQALIRTLVDCGVDVCFANPGTSEMHFVAALDDVPAMRPVLALFEGVATGAADGYARMAGRPAATLLHLGPGLGNGIANLHNARRAHSPVVNIVGDHATYHQRFDAPLQSDIAGLAGPVSCWYAEVTEPAALAPQAVAAVAGARRAPGGVATLVVPADVSWTDGAAPAAPTPAAVSPRPGTSVEPASVEAVAAVLRSGEPTALLLGGPAMAEAGLAAAARVASATSTRLLSETFPAVHERGAGLPAVERLAYLAELTALQLGGLRHLVLVGAPHPVSFFAYPDKPSDLVPDGCTVHTLAAAGDDVVGALAMLVDALDAAGAAVTTQPAQRPAMPGGGALDAQSAAAVIGALLPEGAIVSDEANTSGLFVPGATAGAPRHTWLCLTGGAIGQGLPLATGAAVACPDRKVLCLQADGSALYTAQALWTQAREGLDVTTVVFDNRSYAILAMELGRVGAGTGGARARRMLELDDPPLDMVALSKGMGVPATRATTVEEFAEQLAKALAEPGPALVDAVVPPAV
ncbi:MAG TPA: acetolactate synthase large subunit [Acidimicrobiales bacterium]|nr:acetolactate synthase large subunit [Acidimicrobiales bacterium]